MAHDRFRTPPEERYDVIVVGAGTGGLTAAGLLAARGRKVLVVDAHYVPGGNASVFRRGGYTFDVGIHYIGGCHPGGMIPRVLSAAGVDDVEFEPMDPDAYDTIVLPEGRFEFPRGIDRFEARLIETFPGERRGIRRYVSFLRQIQLMQGLMARPISALWKLPRCLTVLRHARSTFAQFLDTCTSDPRLRAILAAQSGDYALPPSRASALIGAGLTLHYLESGAYFPRGGGQIMADKLAAAIERNGGTVLLRTAARRIHVESAKVTGVTVHNKHFGERTVHADTVISNADLKRTMGELVRRPALAEATLSRVKDYEMSPALGMLYLGLRRDLVGEGHRRINYWIHPSYDQERPYAEVRAGRFPTEPLAFVSIGSVKDPTNRTMAPPGHTNLQVMGLVPSNPEAWGVSEEQIADGTYRKSPAYLEAKAGFERQMLATAERALPGISDDVVFSEVATPITHRRYTRSTDGTSYGIALTPTQFLNGRPPARTEVEGLFLCGASCRTGHGIGGVTMSGLVAASEVLGGGLTREVMRSVRPPSEDRSPVERSGRASPSATPSGDLLGSG